MVVPEKFLDREHLKATLHSQFWGQGVESARVLSGVARTLPCEPPPLSQTTPSGLSRSQQLLLLQRGLDAPCLPSYSAEQGGVVLDRVLFTIGHSNRGWATVTGRLRAQRLWQQQGNGARIWDTLRDPENYSISGRAHLKAGKAKLNASIEVGTLDQCLELWREKAMPRRRPGAQGTSARMHFRAPVLGQQLDATASW